MIESKSIKYKKKINVYFNYKTETTIEVSGGLS